VTGESTSALAGVDAPHPMVAGCQLGCRVRLVESKCEDIVAEESKQEWKAKKAQLLIVHWNARHRGF
jgi:hypothetical protein